jgi:hypothetical protein
MPHGSCWMTATTMINRGTNSPVVEIVTSCSYSSYFAATATTHCALRMSLPRQRSTTTNSAWRLPSRRLQCGRGCTSSRPWEGIADFRYNTLLIPTWDTLHNYKKSPLTRRDQNGQLQPPLCPTCGSAAYDSHPTCWLIVVCGGARIGAAWCP